MRYVTALAEAIYDDRRFADLPILADALEDAGCTSADVLDHCRTPGEHVRGCWVVDLVLEKESSGKRRSSYKRGIRKNLDWSAGFPAIQG